ncbi:hypothetical protein SCP_1202500 [Sparassis crispa]|uniref:Uncharacterized protein n=1 Tax=Sparassis crispa TaxID=139825 RepID=A0A401H0U1_9APHY|nr:hypothetical protein SCP_1202500 [Sparassis crispa]GBE88022.1 hypothetical protein SCP_1202500 [Sparassis crispa]
MSVVLEGDGLPAPVLQDTTNAMYVTEVFADKDVVGNTLGKEEMVEEVEPSEGDFKKMAEKVANGVTFLVEEAEELVFDHDEGTAKENGFAHVAHDDSNVSGANGEVEEAAAVEKSQMDVADASVAEEIAEDAVAPSPTIDGEPNQGTNEVAALVVAEEPAPASSGPAEIEVLITEGLSAPSEVVAADEEVFPTSEEAASEPEAVVIEIVEDAPAPEEAPEQTSAPAPTEEVELAVLEPAVEEVRSEEAIVLFEDSTSPAEPTAVVEEAAVEESHPAPVVNESAAAEAPSAEPVVVAGAVEEVPVAEGNTIIEEAVVEEHFAFEPTTEETVDEAPGPESIAVVDEAAVEEASIAEPVTIVEEAAVGEVPAAEPLAVVEEVAVGDTDASEAVTIVEEVVGAAATAIAAVFREEKASVDVPEVTIEDAASTEEEPAVESITIEPPTPLVVAEELRPEEAPQVIPVQEVAVEELAQEVAQEQAEEYVDEVAEQSVEVTEVSVEVPADAAEEVDEEDAAADGEDVPTDASVEDTEVVEEVSTEVPADLDVEIVEEASADPPEAVEDVSVEASSKAVEEDPTEASAEVIEEASAAASAAVVEEAQEVPAEPAEEAMEVTTEHSTEGPVEVISEVVAAVAAASAEIAAEFSSQPSTQSNEVPTVLAAVEPEDSPAPVQEAVAEVAGELDTQDTPVETGGVEASVAEPVIEQKAVEEMVEAVAAIPVDEHWAESRAEVPPESQVLEAAEQIQANAAMPAEELPVAEEVMVETTTEPAAHAEAVSEVVAAAEAATRASAAVEEAIETPAVVEDAEAPVPVEETEAPVVAIQVEQPEIAEAVAEEPAEPEIEASSEALETTKNAENERSTSPWTPSYSVMVQGLGVAGPEGTEEIAELEQTPIAEAVVKAHETEAAVEVPIIQSDGQEEHIAIEAIIGATAAAVAVLVSEPDEMSPPEASAQVVEVPKSPSWVRSYSVSSQGNSPLPSPKVQALQESKLEAVENMPALEHSTEVEVVAEEAAPANKVPAAVEVEEAVAEETAAEASIVPKGEELMPSSDVPITVIIEEAAPMPPVEETKLEPSATAIEVPKSPSWIPSYSVSSHGNSPLLASNVELEEEFTVEVVAEVPVSEPTAEPVVVVEGEESVPVEAVLETAAEAREEVVPFVEVAEVNVDDEASSLSAEAPEIPKSPTWVPSYSVSSQGSSILVEASEVESVPTVEARDEISAVVQEFVEGIEPSILVKVDDTASIASTSLIEEAQGYPRTPTITVAEVDASEPAVVLVVSSEAPEAVDSEEPKSIWVPSYSVSSQGSSPAHAPQATVDRDVENLEPLQTAEEVTKSPWVPSYSVSSQGTSPVPAPQATEDAEVDELEPLQAAEEPPKSPWIPSYSVSSQGATPDVKNLEPLLAPVVDSIASASAEITSSTEEAVVAVVEAQIAVEEEPVVAEESVGVGEPAVVEEQVVVEEPAVVEEQVDIGDRLTLETSAVIAAELERPNSPWTPSYSVNQQGASPLRKDKELNEVEQTPVPAAEPAEDVQIESKPPSIHLDKSAELGMIEAEAAVLVEERPERPWTPSYSVTTQGPDVANGKAHTEKEENFNQAIQSNVSNGHTELQAFPTVENGEPKKMSTKPSLARLVPVNEDEQIEIEASATSVAEPVSPTHARQRLESTTSSRFFPGGWFSSTPKSHDKGRASHETAAGEFSKSPTSATSTPALEVPTNTPTEGIDEKKKGWCTIM